MTLPCSSPCLLNTSLRLPFATCKFVKLTSQCRCKRDATLCGADDFTQLKHSGVGTPPAVACFVSYMHKTTAAAAHFSVHIRTNQTLGSAQFHRTVRLLPLPNARAEPCGTVAVSSRTTEAFAEPPDNTDYIIAISSMLRLPARHKFAARLRIWSAPSKKTAIRPPVRTISPPLVPVAGPIADLDLGSSLSIPLLRVPR